VPDLLGVGKLAGKGYDAFRAHRAVKVAKRFKKATEKALDDAGLSQYNKLIGATVGGGIGWLVTQMPFLGPMFNDAQTMEQFVTLLTTLLGVWAAPANKEAK